MYQKVDFFGELAQIVYKNGWKAKNVKHLIDRIKYALKKVDPKGVQSACTAISSKLRIVADKGPFAKVH